MALQKKTTEEMIDRPRSLRPEGWYSLAFSKGEAKQAKSTQHYYNAQFRALAEEGNPDSAVGGPLFFMVMFDAVEDEEAFAQSIADKKGIDGDELEQEIKARKAMAQEGAANFGFAILGYDDFSPVPRKNKDTGKYEMPDGSEVKVAAERQALYKARQTEAYNAAIEIARCERDVTRYTCYGKLVHGKDQNGEPKEELKYLKAFLPAGETLQKVG